jgi:Cof subfamily protein (haloacid dehalogenase superfamily)
LVAEIIEMASLTDLLVVSDMDGTLFQAGYGIPKENIDAIERFVEKGGRFTVCTGRSVPSVRRYIDWLQPTVPAVLNNGALIYDYRHEKVLFNVNLPDSVMGVVNEVMATFPDVGVEMHSTKGITVLRHNDQTYRHTGVEHIPYDMRHVSVVKGRWNKVLFAATAQRIKHLANFIDKKQKSDPSYRGFDFVSSSEFYYELMPHGVNKGTGLKKLAGLLDMDVKNTVAIGDYYNDLPMMDAAGYSAAVADAPPEVRGRADIVVSSCLQGGAGEFLDSLETICGGFEQLTLDL